MRKLLVSIAAALVATSCATPEKRPVAERPAQSAIGSPERQTGRAPREEVAPDFSVTTFQGERFALGEHRGTPVVLNFWESW